MMFLNSLLLAWRSVRRNLLRSFLTVLGVVIGVAAVVTMVTLGEGVSRSMQTELAGLGTNRLMIFPGQRLGPGRSTAGAPGFTEADAEAIATQIGGVAEVAPQASSQVTVVYQAKNWSTQVIGSTNAYFAINNRKLSAGRYFSATELRGGEAVCVIGSTLQKELFASAAAADIVGAAVRVKQFSCSVIGVMAGKGTTMGPDPDDQVILPLATMQRRVTGNRFVGNLVVAVAENAEPARVKTALSNLLRERRKLGPSDDDNFNVFDSRELLETVNSTMRTMTAFVGSIAAISLLVGGIGIMNIMLVSVTERTREIGVRLAIGALEGEVLLQFLVEAVVLSSLGGIIGILIATVVSVVASQFADLPYLFNVGINLIAFGFSAAIGVIFGFFPARRAAALNPIDALRQE